jgi:hypothetical protein
VSWPYGTQPGSGAQPVKLPDSQVFRDRPASSMGVTISFS